MNGIKLSKKTEHIKIENLLYGNYEDLKSIQFKYQKKIFMKVTTYFKFLLFLELKIKIYTLELQKQFIKLNKDLKTY